MSDTLLAFTNRKNWLKKQSQKWAHNYTYGNGRLPTPVLLGFPWSSAGKESTCNAGDLVSIPVLGRYTGEGKGYPLQYSGLENSIDCIVYGVTKSQTRLSDLHSLLWDWNENWPFSVLWPLLSFPNLLAYWVHHFHSIIF